MTTLYSVRRKEIKTGDLIAWKTNEIDSFFGLVLYLYQKILGANFTHVGVAVSLEGRVFVVEATPPEARIIPLRLCGDFYHIPVELTAKPKKMINFLFSYIGKPYSILDLAKGILKLSRNKQDLYCSELTEDFYSAFGYLTEKKGQTPDTMVNAILEANGGEIVKVVIDKGNLS